MFQEETNSECQRKHTVSDIASFSGPPLFSSVRPIGQLWLPNKERFYQYCESIYEQGCLTNNGPLVRLLEERLLEVHQCRHCVAFANASIAIIALLKLVARNIINASPGEIILPAFTYSGLPHLIRWAGFIPKFVDIDEDTHAISPEAAEHAITKNVVAILAVHQVNSPADTKMFTKISEKHDVPVVYDSVHGVFGSINGVLLGNFGEAEVFSLHATKLINGFEGGYITTNQEALAKELQLIRNFGMISEEATAMIGLNGKLNEVHAALALASLDDHQTVLSRNKQRYEHYAEAFKSVPDVSWVEYPSTSKRGDSLSFNYEFFLLKIPNSWPLSRDEVVMLLRSEAGLARGYYDPPVHLSSHFPKELDRPSLPITEKLSRYYIQMPVGELVSDSDIDILRDWFCFIYENADSIRSKFRTADITV